MMSWIDNMGKMNFEFVMDFCTAGVGVKNSVCNNITDFPSGKEVPHIL